MKAVVVAAALVAVLTAALLVTGCGQDSPVRLRIAERSDTKKPQGPDPVRSSPARRTSKQNPVTPTPAPTQYSSGIQYSYVQFTYPIGKRMDLGTPVPNRLIQQNLDSFTVSPALPAGLELDQKTGRISGVPIEEALATAYQVTGTNGTDTLSTWIFFSIVAPDAVSAPAQPTAI